MDARQTHGDGRKARPAAPAALAAVVLLSVLPVAAEAAQRVTLVIGNDGYAHVPLPANPGNDAKAMDDAFERLGYSEGVVAHGREEAEERRKHARVPGTKFRDCPECPEMVVVPSGSFMMGSPESESGRYDGEGPVHPVTIARPFAVGVKEVTRGEFR